MAIQAPQPSLDILTLPSGSSSDLLIVPATAAEYEQTWRLNADEWKGPLTQPQYFEREAHLLGQELSKDTTIAWILTSRALPLNSDGTRPILSSCESLFKSGYVARNGKLEKVRVHGVASVYTDKRYRGKGYAGRMMAELGKKLETFQQVNGDRSPFSVLFSDIGKTFYARHGWKAFPSTHIHLAPLDADQYANATRHLPAVEDLSKEDLNNLPTVQYFEDRIRRVSEQNPNIPCVAIKADTDSFGWHQAREEITSKLMGLPFPLVKGAIHKATGIAIIWSRVFATNPMEWSLYILHVMIPPEVQRSPATDARDGLAALLLRAQREASAWKLVEGVHVWDPTDLAISAAQRLRVDEQDPVEIISRDENHINCLRWTGAKSGDDQTKDVIWVNAEKYAWS